MTERNKLSNRVRIHPIDGARRADVTRVFSFAVFYHLRFTHSEVVSAWLLEGPGEWLDDRGLSHGLGLFETMLVIDGEILDSESHIARMATGCTRLGLGAPDWQLAMESIRERSRELETGLIRARLMRTSGAGELSQVGGSGESTVLNLVPWISPPMSLRVATAPWIRDQRSPLAGVKCTSYAEHLMAIRHARSLDHVDELLFANSMGHWCEGTTSNGFAMVDGELVTPSLASGCLPGTMRAKVLRWAVELGIPCCERPIAMEELMGATEMFLTSAIRGVVPVSSCDGMNLTQGAVTEAFMRRWTTLSGLDAD